LLETSFKLKPGKKTDKDADAKKGWTKAEKSSIKKKFSGFNKEFESNYNEQKHYFIPDEELRKTIRSDTNAILLDQYKKFHDIYSQVPFSKKQGEYVRYSPETLEEMLNKLFEGLEEDKKAIGVKMFH